MYLSMFNCNALSVHTLGLVSRSAIKNFLWKLFPLSQEREFLWRMKPSINGGLTLLILSSDVPYHHDAAITIKSKEIPLSYFGASSYQFSVDTTPIKSSPVIGGRGKRINLYNDSDIRDWFIKKATRYGFSVDPDLLEIRSIDKVYIKNRDKTWQYPRAVICGHLKVIDPNLFMNTMVYGFGTGKGFGFGLIELKKV